LNLFDSMDGATSATLTMLASGSSGNAALVRAGDFGLLIDLGIGPRTLARRMAQAGLGWKDVHAVVLTHTHGDHWRENSLAHVHARGMAVFCHDSHIQYLTAVSRAFGELRRAGRVTDFRPGRPFSPGGGLRFVPLELEHDSHRTFGFRIEDVDGGCSAGYVADLGRFDEALVDLLSDLDLLALEFNHDESMQLESGRPRELIDRILGPFGHLSNRQASTFLRAILRCSERARPHTIVPLHLSRECNRAELAESAAREALAETGHAATIVVSKSAHACPTLKLKSNQSPSAGGMVDAGRDPSETRSPEAGTSTPPRQT
jgi:phosphoribosyl 1,2-cyclic phosphodiesterase